MNEGGDNSIELCEWMNEYIIVKSIMEQTYVGGAQNATCCAARRNWSGSEAYAAAVGNTYKERENRNERETERKKRKKEKESERKKRKKERV